MGSVRRARCGWCQERLVQATIGNLDGVWVCPTEVCRQRQLDQAVVIRERGKDPAVLNVPLPSQVPIDESTARNLLWGGQAGPGKSHGARWWLYKRSLMVPGHQGLLLRENWDQLYRTHMRAMESEVPKLGGTFSVSNRIAKFANGSVIDCGHMAEPEAVANYLSTEYGAIVPDEAATYPIDANGISPLAELSTRARKVYTDQAGREVRPRFLPVTNPGGPSAEFLMQFFITHEPDWDRYPRKLREVYDPANWLYVPAALDDNPYNDPEYETTLAILSPWRYEQLRHGNWFVFAGQFFGEWVPERHAREVTFDPSDVLWFASLDWGFNAPGCCIWWIVLPDGRLHIARDFKFQYKTANVVAKQIREITDDLGAKLTYLVADPAIWQRTGHGRGETVAETMQRHRLPMRKGDNDRYNGWQRVHELLQDAPDGEPWLTVSPLKAPYVARSIPAQRSAKNDPDDVDTNGDDHAADALRYGAMSRPPPGGRTGRRIRRAKPWTLGWLKQQESTAPGLLARRR